MQPQCVVRLRAAALLFLGLCLIVLSSILPIVWPSFYTNMIADQLRMTPDSKTFQVWKDNPVPIYIEFFFFNWTNHESLKEEGELHIPQFQEIGPYRFTEKVKRVNVTWNHNSTITYRQARWWHFDQEHSKGSLDDDIVTLNAVALTAAFTVRDWNYFLRATTSTALGVTGQNVHIVRKVRELLFEGYSDKLIKIAKSMPSFSGVKVPFDKFGWFYKRNGSSFMDGLFNMNTGVDDIRKMGKVESWNYRNSTDFFADDCAKVKGTSGQLFPPGQTRDRSVEMFSPDLCRSLAFEYSEDAMVNDVHGYRYVGGLSMLDNGTVFTDKECFCNGECVPSGVVNMTSCRFGAPAFASFPHFYLADSFFTDNVRGLRPNKEKHQFYLVLEPTTGVPLDVAARFQINVLLQPLPGIDMFEQVPTVFFPMLWFQQRATIPRTMAITLQLLLYLRYFGVILAVVIALVSSVTIGYSLLLCARVDRMKTIPMDNNKEETNMYVAALDSPRNKKTKSNHYIIMKPKNQTALSAKS